MDSSKFKFFTVDQNRVAEASNCSLTVNGELTDSLGAIVMVIMMRTMKDDEGRMERKHSSLVSLA